MRILWMVLAAAAQMAAADGLPPVTAIEESGLKQLLTVRRIFVDRLTGGETAAQMRDILISSLDGAKLFIMTENQEKADAVLRGAAEDLVFTETHNSSDSINAHVNAGTGRSASSSYYQRSNTGFNAGLGAGESESTHSAERRHEAVAAVRLVNKDGDVIWSTTQESLGAKFHGASADVADKITAKIREDYERARRMNVGR